MQLSSSMLWQRLDAPGHDACRLERHEAGFRLRGTAVCLEAGAPASLAYTVECDDGWRTRRGLIHGWIGAVALDFHIVRDPHHGWTCNGQHVDGLAHCLDLDLGFTPATNLFQLRRLSLREGEAADNPVAWFDITTGKLELVVQRYERRTADTYWYESARFNYRAMLEVDAHGFVRRYPQLWEAQSEAPT
jgi:hypothetical protein